MEGRRRLEEFRRGRKSRAPLVNLGECTRGKGEGVESVMSRNLGVPRIYSRWRGGSTNRACREFAIVIIYNTNTLAGLYYGHGWLQLPVFRFFFRFVVGGTRAPQFFANDRSIVCMALFADNVVDGTN